MFQVIAVERANVLLLPRPLWDSGLTSYIWLTLCGHLVHLNSNEQHYGEPQNYQTCRHNNSGCMVYHPVGEIPCAGAWDTLLQVELERRLRPFCEESACICESPLSILRLPPVQRLARFGGLSSIYPAFCPYDCSDSLQPNHDPELTWWMNRWMDGWMDGSTKIFLVHVHCVEIKL